MQVSLEHQEAVVEFNSELIQLDQIKDAIEDMGYVTVVKYNAISPHSAANTPRKSVDLIRFEENSDNDRSQRKFSTESENMGKVVIGVKGMHCQSCVRKIEGDLKNIDGIRSVSVSLKQESAEIYFDDNKVTIHSLAKRICDLNFTASLPNGKTYSPIEVNQTSNNPDDDMSYPSVAVLPVKSTTSQSNGSQKKSLEGNSRHAIEKRKFKSSDKLSSQNVIVPINDANQRCTIAITGMTCASCVNNIERNIGECRVTTLLVARLLF